MKILKITTVLLSMLLGTVAIASTTPNIGEVSDTTLNIFSFTTQVISAGTLAMGIAFLFSACLKYKYHRDNPSQMPLSNPVTLFILATTLLVFTVFINVSERYVYGANGGMPQQFDKMMFKSSQD